MGNASGLWKIGLLHSSSVLEPLQRQRPAVAMATVTLRAPPSSSSNVTQVYAFFGRIVPQLPENDVIYLIKPNDETSCPAGMDTIVPQSSEMMMMMMMGDRNDLAFQALPGF